MTKELDSLLQRKIENFESFRDGENGVWTMIDAAYLVARTLVAGVVKEANLSSSETHRLMMWQTVLEYQMESFFLILDKQLDAGMALMRKVDLTNMRARLVGLTVIDEGGQRLFTDDEVDLLGAKSGAALDRVFAIAQKLNGLSGADVEELTKNSSGVPSAVSTSDSALPSDSNTLTISSQG